MGSGLIDQSRLTSDVGIDVVVSNSRMRASQPGAGNVTIGTVTFLNNPLGTNYICGTGAPISTAPGASSTIDIGQLLTGMVIQQPSVANTSTLDTAANIVQGIMKMSAGPQVGDIIECYFGNGSGSFTVTLAAGSGGTFDANQPASARVIAVNSSRWVLVRLTNVTLGSEAYTIYL
jgi:hypothetical protein